MSELLEKHEDDVRANRRGWRKFFILFGLVIIALRFYIFKDEAPPDDAWMLPKFTPGGEGKNPLAVFIDASKNHPLQGTKEAPNPKDFGDKDKEPAMREFVQKNESAIRSFDELMKTDPVTWRWPGIDEKMTFSSSISGLSECQAVAGQLLRIKIELLARDGKAENAAEEALRIVRFGQGLGGAEGVIVHYWVAITVEQNGEGGLKSALTAPDVGEPLLRSSQEALMSFDIKTVDLRFALRVEYLALKNSFKTFLNDSSMVSSTTLYSDQQALVYKYFTQINRSLHNHLKFQKPVLQALEKDWPAIIKAGQIQDKDIRAWRNNWLRFYVSPNVGGNMLLCLSLPTLGGSIYTRGAQCCALHRQAIIMIALRRYELEQGKLPEKLDELVPKFLDSVSADPFDNAPMRWNAADRVVYSIGKDLKDDNGAVSEPRNNKDKDTGMRYWWSAK